MQLRRFTADTTPAALSAVRMAIGDDAIILANRRVGDHVEIIATTHIDDVSVLLESSVDGMTASLAVSPVEPTKPRSDAVQAVYVPSGPVCIDADADLEYDDSRTVEQSVGNSEIEEYADIPADTLSLSGLRSELNTRAATNYHQADAKEGAQGAVPHPIDSGSSDFHQSSTNSDASHGTPAIKIDEDIVAVSTLDSLATALEIQAKRMDQHFHRQEINLWGVNAPNRRLHLQQLLSLGIGAELAIRLVERCAPELSSESAIRQSLSLLKKSINIARDTTLEVPGVTIMYGPPGAGKTTALMKLATEHVRTRDSQSIVIICADTRRIGAFEELQAYGRLLGVPTVHAHDAAELTSLMAAFQQKKLVLIDHTLPQDEKATQLPRSLHYASSPGSVRHLFALPATCQASTADVLIERYCKSHKMQLVLTNLDSSARFGELLNAIIRHEASVAYWSDDPSVQKPLEAADASVLIATAVAMRKRIDQSVDDQWLHRLIQPSNQVFPTRMEAAEESVKNCA